MSSFGASAKNRKGLLNSFGANSVSIDDSCSATDTVGSPQLSVDNPSLNESSSSLSRNGDVISSSYLQPKYNDDSGFESDTQARSMPNKPASGLLSSLLLQNRTQNNRVGSFTDQQYGSQLQGLSSPNLSAYSQPGTPKSQNSPLLSHNNGSSFSSSQNVQLYPESHSPALSSSSKRRTHTAVGSLSTMKPSVVPYDSRLFSEEANSILNPSYAYDDGPEDNLTGSDKDTDTDILNENNYSLSDNTSNDAAEPNWNSIHPQDNSFDSKGINNLNETVSQSLLNQNKTTTRPMRVSKKSRCCSRPCLRKQPKYGIHYWIGEGSISLLIISLILTFFGITLLTVGTNPHPGTWVRSLCHSNGARFYSPCRKDFECSVCRVDTKLDMNTSDLTIPISPVEVTLSIRSTLEQCDTIYADSQKFFCRYPLLEILDEAIPQIKTESAFSESKKIYRSQLTQGYWFLGFGIIGLTYFFFSGFIRYRFYPLVSIFPKLRAFTLRSIFSSIISICCSRNAGADDEEQFVPNADVGVYVQIPNEANQAQVSKQAQNPGATRAPVSGLEIPADLSRVRQDKVYTDKTTGTRFKLEGIAIVPSSMLPGSAVPSLSNAQSMSSLANQRSLQNGMENGSFSMLPNTHSNNSLEAVGSVQRSSSLNFPSSMTSPSSMPMAMNSMNSISSRSFTQNDKTANNAGFRPSSFSQSFNAPFSQPNHPQSHMQTQTAPGSMRKTQSSLVTSSPSMNSPTPDERKSRRDNRMVDTRDSFVFGGPDNANPGWVGNFNPLETMTPKFRRYIERENSLAAMAAANNQNNANQGPSQAPK